MANNLKDHLKEVADAIRAKKGTSDLINPQNFATEIEGISGSGGGESTIEYLDLREDVGVFIEPLIILSCAVRGKTTADDKSVLIATPLLYNLTEKYATTMVAIDFSAMIVLPYPDNIQLSVAEFLAMQGVDASVFPRITKEQFYDLNA